MKRHFQLLSLVVGVTLLSSSTRITFAAEETATSAATPTPSSTPFVEKITYSSPLIGAQAPDFALPDMARKMWKLSDHTGQRTILLLVVSGQPRPNDESDSGEAVLSVLKKQAARLQSQNVDVVLATQGIAPRAASKASATSTGTTSSTRTVATPQPAAQIGHTITKEDRELLHILRDDGSLANLYGVVPQRVVGVLIDRYGFLREVNYWPFASASLDAALQNLDVESPKIEVGKIAPDFALADADGQFRRLSDLRGRRNVLLTFFPEGSSCGCGSQLPSVENDQAIFRKANTDIWLLSSDDAEHQKELMQTLHASTVFLPDINKKVALLFGATANVEDETEGMSILIDKNGIIRSIDKIPGRLYGDNTLSKLSSPQKQ